MTPGALLALADDDLHQALAVMNDHDLRELAQWFVFDPSALPSLLRRLVPSDLMKAAASGAPSP